MLIINDMQHWTPRLNRSLNPVHKLLEAVLQDRVLVFLYLLPGNRVTALQGDIVIPYTGASTPSATRRHHSSIDASKQTYTT